MKIRDNVKPSLPPIPGGNYLGICVYSIGIGEQLCEYEGKSKSYNNQVMLGFEICGITIEIDGKQEPRVLGKTFNIAKSKKASIRKFIGAWEAKELSDDEFLDVDTNDYVGRPGLVTIVVNETGEYSNIESISPLPVGLPVAVPEPMSKLIRFDMEPWDQAAFEALPEWAQEKVKKSTQYQKEHVPVANVAVQGGQALQGGIQMPQNIQGINFGAMMQTPAMVGGTLPQSAGPTAPSWMGPGAQSAGGGMHDQGSQGLGGTNGGIATTSVSTGFAMTGGTSSTPAGHLPQGGRQGGAPF